MDGKSTVSSGMWLKFFTNAGIPESVSASYANKFAENRIKRDMIKDLTKDILRDMGVTCMGDIIAILRHAKEVYDEEILERVIGQSNSSVQTATVRPTKVSSGRRSSPAPRTQDHRVRRPASTSDGSSARATDVENSPVVPDRVKSASHRETRSSSCISSVEKVFRKQARSSVAEEPTSSASRKRLESSSAGQSLHKADSSTSVKRKIDDEVPVKKVRRVLPEHEGGYKITMPSGTTARTQEILRKKALLHAAHKKSVFDRLGAGCEDEVQEVVVPVAPSMDTTFKVTGLDSVPFKCVASGAKPSSVFSRLGDKSLPSTAPESAGVATQKPLPYHGILKQSNNKIVVKRPSVSPESLASGVGSTMRADEEERPRPANRKRPPSIATTITTVVLSTGKPDAHRIVSGQRCTMRADEEVCLKVVGPSPVVKRLRTSVRPPTPATAPADKPVMRQIFRNRATQGILAAPANHQKISVKSRLGVGSTSPERTVKLLPEKKVMFEKREVSFGGSSEKTVATTRRAKVTYFQKPVRVEQQGPPNFKRSVFHRLGRNRYNF